MSIERWAGAGVRVIAPAAALLLLSSLMRGEPFSPTHAPYILALLVLAAASIGGRAGRRWPRWQKLCGAAAIWLCATSAAWHAQLQTARSPEAADRRLEQARTDLSRRFDLEMSLLQSLLDGARARAESEVQQPENPAAAWSRAVSRADLAEAEGLSLYDSEGVLLAWAGATSEAPLDLLIDTVAAAPTFDAARRGGEARAFAAVRVGGGLVLVAERQIGAAALSPPSTLVPADTRVEVEFQTRDDARRAYEDFYSLDRPLHRPRARSRQPAIFFPLRAPDGTLLATAQARDLTLNEREAVLGGLWRDVGVVGLEVILLLGLRGVLRGFPSLTGAGEFAAASVLLWTMRALAASLGFPHLPALQPLFQYTDFASALLGAWGDSPGDYFLTLLTALAQTGLLFCARRCVRCRSQRDGARRAAVWIVRLSSSAAALVALRLLAHDLARGARPVLSDSLWSGLDAPALVLQGGFFAGAAALTLALIAVGGWSPRPGLTLAAVGIALMTLVSHTLLQLETEDSRRSLVRSNVLQTILDQEWRREVALRESLNQILQDPRLPAILRSGGSDDYSEAAYEIWSETEIAQQGLESSLRLVDARGEVVSRFGLDLPETVEQALQRTVLAGPGPARARVRLASVELPVLLGRRALLQDGVPLGGVEIVVADTFDNVPSIPSPSPYTLLFRPSAALTQTYLAGTPLHFTVYDGESRQPIFTNDPLSPPPLPASLAASLGADSEPTWAAVPHGRQRLHLIYALRGERIFAVGYPSPGPARTAAGFLQAVLRHLVYAAALAALLLAALAHAPLRRLRYAIRARRPARTFYRRLLVALLLASLVPLVALALSLEGMLAHEIEQEVHRLGSSALGVSRRVVADYMSLVSRGRPAADDNLLYWLSQATRQDIHVYRGSDLMATSRRELFASGLLSTRLPPQVYRDLVEARLPSSLRRERVAGRSFLVISGRLELPEIRGAEWIVSLPLAVQQEEVQAKLRDARDAVLLTTAFLLLLLSLMAYFVATRIASPIRAVASAAGRLAAGDLDVRVERQAEAELQVLIDVFNRMALAIRAQQDDLRARRDYIEKILLNATTGVVSFDTGGRVVAVNPSARLLTGAPLEPGAVLAAALERAGLGPLAAILPASPTSFSERREEVELRAGAEEQRLRAVLVPLRDEGNPSGGLLLLEDVTESVRSNRLRAWAEMAQRIAHEVKNPLTPILLSAEHLRHVYRERPAEFAPVLEDCLRTITEQVAALRRMSREFGAYARIPEPQLERADVRGVVEEALAPYLTASPPGLLIERRWDDQPLWARLDRTLLRRALVNLIENSLDALGGSGTIRIGIDALVERGRPWVRILVDDDGPGIDPAVAPRLFEPFFSTKGSGTGLGLAIVRQAVEAHGGSVRVGRPPAGRGTRMIVLLPGATG
jgi:signal transduction histidine kinase